MRSLKESDIVRAFNACQNDYTIEIMDNGKYVFMYNYTGVPIKIGGIEEILSFARFKQIRAFNKEMGNIIKELRQEDKRNNVKIKDNHIYYDIHDDVLIRGCDL